MNSLKNSLRELKKYPSAIFGAVIVLLLVLLAIFAMIKIPYSEAIRLWRGGEEVWYQNPKNVPPVWYNWFSKTKLPESLAIKGGEDEHFTKTVTPKPDGTANIDFEYEYDYSFDDFPQELFLYFTAKYVSQTSFCQCDHA